MLFPFSTLFQIPVPHTPNLWLHPFSDASMIPSLLRRAKLLILLVKRWRYVRYFGDGCFCTAPG